MRSEPVELLTRPQRLHVVSPIFLLLKQARQLVPVLFAFVLIRRQLAFLVPVLLALMALTVLQWWRRTWEFDGRSLVVDEGVLNRKHRVVPVDRIQQVNLRRSLVHRVLGVASVRVETAGGSGGSEVDLDVISLAEAERLREVLLRAKAGAALGDLPAVATPEGQPAPAQVAPPERVVARLSLGQVALAGVTGARAAAALAVLGPIIQYGDDFHLLGRLFGWVDPEQVAGLGPVVLGAAGLAALVVWFGLAAGASVLTDYGFTMVIRGSDLRVRRGLLERREAVVPLARIQVVRVEESVLRRALRMGAIRVQSAGSGGRRQQDADRVAIPLLPRAAFAAVLDQLLPGAVPVPALARPPSAARRRAVVRAVRNTVPFAAGLGLLGWLLGGPPLTAAVVVVLLACAFVLGLAAWANLGHARVGRFLYARTGALIRTTSVVPTAKAQSARVTATPFQRRSGLATLHVDVAGPGPTPRVVDEAAGRAEWLLDSVLERQTTQGG
jgi:putative membrane protein